MRHSQWGRGGEPQPADALEVLHISSGGRAQTTPLPLSPEWLLAKKVSISSSKRGDPKTSRRPYKHTWRSTMSHVHWRGQQLSNVKDPKKLLRVDVDRQENNFAAKTKSDRESGAHTEALP